MEQRSTVDSQSIEFQVRLIEAQTRLAETRAKMHPAAQVTLVVLDKLSNLFSILLALFILFSGLTFLFYDPHFFYKLLGVFAHLFY